jgi:hypothetical protein
MKGCGVWGVGCGVQGYLLHPLLHTPDSLTLYFALFKIVLPYQDKDNIFKILCQYLKSKFFAVFFALIVALWGNVRIRMSRMKGCGVRGAVCSVRGYLLLPLLHTPHSLTLYFALLKIVLPYQDDDNIFKILCQHQKANFSRFFCVLLAVPCNL